MANEMTDAEIFAVAESLGYCTVIDEDYRKLCRLPVGSRWVTSMQQEDVIAFARALLAPATPQPEPEHGARTDRSAGTNPPEPPSMWPELRHGCKDDLADDEAFRQFQRDRIEAARKHDAEQAKATLAHGVPASPEPHPFTFHWLVELRPAFHHHPPFPATYYAGWIDGIEAAKTTDPLEAVRFTSKDHAERMAKRLGFTLSCVWTAVEHGFATDGVRGAPQPDLKDLLDRFQRQAQRFGELWERCQGKGWPDAESAEFTDIRDEQLPALRRAIEDACGVKEGS